MKIKTKTKENWVLQDRYQFQGLPISVENKAGSFRRGVDKDGHKWKTYMHYDYGYIRSTEASDGEAVDCYVNKKGRGAQHVFVVHQKQIEKTKQYDGGKCPICGKLYFDCMHHYDEDKVMLGFSSKVDAIGAYLNQYDSPLFLGPVSTYTVDEFKKALKESWGKRLPKQIQQPDEWIGVDLDGTLAEYHGWDKGKIGKPIPAMMDRVWDYISKGGRVKIMTARADDKKQIPVIKEWLKQNELPDLEITNIKDRHMIELWDDRAVRVDQNTGKVLNPTTHMEKSIPAFLFFSMDKAFVKGTTYTNKQGKLVQRKAYFDKRQKKVAKVRHARQHRVDMDSKTAEKHLEKLKEKLAHHKKELEHAKQMHELFQKHKEAGNHEHKVGGQEHHVDKILKDLKDHIQHHENEHKSHSNRIRNIEQRHETEQKHWDKKRKERKKKQAEKKEKRNHDKAKKHIQETLGSDKLTKDDVHKVMLAAKRKDDDLYAHVNNYLMSTRPDLHEAVNASGVKLDRFQTIDEMLEDGHHEGEEFDKDLISVLNKMKDEPADEPVTVEKKGKSAEPSSKTVVDAIKADPEFDKKIGLLEDTIADHLEQALSQGAIAKRLPDLPPPVRKGDYAGKLKHIAISSLFGKVEKNDFEDLKHKVSAVIDEQFKPEKSDAEKHQNRSDAMKGNKNAYKGGPKNEPKGLFDKPFEEIKELVEAKKLTNSMYEEEQEKASYRHNGHKIYPMILSTGIRWATQSVENKEREERGERQIGGDTIHDTKAEAEKEVEFITNQHTEKVKQEQAAAAEAKAKEEQAAKEKTERADLDGFTDGMKALERGKVEKDLNQLIRFDEGIMSKRERVKKLFAAGKLELDTYQENKVKGMSRKQYFRASQREQEANDRKIKEGGKKTVYFVNGSDLGKTAYDYAQHLLSQSKKSEPEKTEQEKHENRSQAMLGNKNAYKGGPKEETKTRTEKIEDFGEKIGGARKDMAVSGNKKKGGKDAKDDTPPWRKRYRVAESAAGENKGKFFLVDEKGKYGGLLIRKFFDTKEEAEDVLPLAVVAKKHGVYKSREDEKYGIYRNVTDRKRALIKGGFETEEAAKAYMAKNAVDIIETKTRIDDSIHPVLKDPQREGKDYRNGKDVGAKDFHDTFGFRGVEFGNWNNSAERQHILNHAYDSFMDLSKALGLTPKEMSLDGELALGFGSRGQGLSGAKAHYERNYGAINLTKMKGMGSLAHEWFHALDHYISRKAGKAVDERVKNKAGDMVFQTKGPEEYSTYGFYGRHQLSDKLKAGLRNIVSAMNEKDIEFVDDESKIERIQKRGREELEKEIANVREAFLKDYSKEEYSRFRGKKNLPATDQQMEEVNRLLSEIKKGNLGEDVELPSKSKWAMNRAPENIVKLNALYKDVRGRQGIIRDNNGRYGGALQSLNAKAQTQRRYKKALAEAQEKKVKTKKITSDYRSEAWKMDQGGAKDYWGSRHEMAARAFEAWIYDKIKKNGGQNDFLTYKKHNNHPEYMLLGVKPYPEGQERENINKAFEQFFSDFATAGDDRFKKTEAEEHQNRSQAMQGNQNAYKGGPKEEPEKPRRTASDVPDSASRGSKTKAEGTSHLKQHDDFTEKLNSGDMTPEGIKDHFRKLVQNKDAIIQELSKHPIKKLMRHVGPIYRGAKKAEIVEAAYDGMLDRLGYINRDSITWSLGEDKHEVVKRHIDSLTDDDIKQHVEKKQKADAERKEMVEAIKNPKTLDDYQRFIHYFGAENLSPKQQETFDQLHLEETLSKRKEAEEKASEVKKVDMGGVGLEVGTHTHTKTGEEKPVVKMAERVDRDKYKELNTKAKQLGGYYSKYAKGFLFKDEDSAKKFAGLSEGDQSAKEEKASRKQTKQEKAISRIKKMADNMEAKGQESLNQDRRVNTARQARMASGAEADARAAINQARMMRAIADGIENGKVKLLSNIKYGKDIEDLGHHYRQAKMQEALKVFDDKETDGMNRSKKYEEIKNGPVTEEHIRNIKYPFPTMHENTFNMIVSDIGDKTAGVQKDINKIKKKLKPNGKGSRVAMFGHGDIDLLRRFVQKAGKRSENKYSMVGIKESLAAYDRLQRMGITDTSLLRSALREYHDVRSGVKGELADPIKALERKLVGKKIPGFFPTPKPVIENNLLEKADIRPGMTVLEPSAGKGDIADSVKANHPDANVAAIEINPELSEMLKEKGHEVVDRDFLQHDKTYDRIVMNPPFENGMDAEHVQHAYKLLTDNGGKLVAVMSSGPFFRSDKKSQAFREWVEQNGGIVEDLPEGTFKGTDSFRQTGVSAKVLTMSKSMGDWMSVSDMVKSLPDFRNKHELLDALQGNPKFEVTLRDNDYYCRMAS